MRKYFFVIFILPAITFSQSNDLNDVAGDLISLTDQYVAPAAEATTYQSSSGWYTSAQKKELWDLEISLQANFLFVPKNKRNFLVTESSLVNLTIQGDDDSAQIPTALGGESNVVLEGSINEEVFEFDAPEGLDQSYVNHYQLQAGLGLWKGTTLIARYSPKIKINKTFYQVLGVGIQHNLSQWFSKEKQSEFDVAALVSYTNYNVSDEFSKVDLILGSINAIDVEGESVLFNLLASKNIEKFRFSTGVGLTLSNFSYKIGGEGDLLLSILNQALTTLETNKTNFKADLGVDYKLKHFSVNTMLTFGKYTNLLFGLNYNI